MVRKAVSSSKKKPTANAKALPGDESHSSTPSEQETPLEEASKVATEESQSQSQSSLSPTRLNSSNISKVMLADVAGLENAKRALLECVKYPLLIPEYFDAMNIDPWGGVLLFGPPGTGRV